MTFEEEQELLMEKIGDGRQLEETKLHWHVVKQNKETHLRKIE